MRRARRALRRPLGAARLLPALLCAGLLAGCASAPPCPEVSPEPAAGGSAGSLWQRIRFWVHWPEDADPAWHVDALLAHRVIAPVLERHRDAIELWRFHRRAARDAAGHSLSLLVFAPPALGELLCERLRADPEIDRLIRLRVLDKVECSAPAGERAARVSGTSDADWPAEIQRAWPYYIQGVSEMWLRLIDEYAPSGDEPGDLDAVVERYRGTHERLTRAWAREGEHAFLHHLNALFAYEPVYLIERRAYSF